MDIMEGVGGKDLGGRNRRREMMIILICNMHFYVKKYVAWAGEITLFFFTPLCVVCNAHHVHASTHVCINT